ncbi:MAG TPA: MBL fold metallo-hydrolase [Clostridia bacterium]|nr:MBL fold metallo-hydrolase [Clostridia bacterium]
MLVKNLSVGPIETNCYILCDETAKKAAVIDPGFEAEKILEELGRTGCSAEYVILTHGHFDHISAAGQVAGETGAKLAAFAEEEDFIKDPAANLSSGFGKGIFKPLEPDILVRDGETLALGSMTLRFLLTPGHTGGSGCILCGDCLFTGDTLFRGGAGRTDFPTGDYPSLIKSLRRLASLKGDYRVYPGHGGITSLNAERRSNPYLAEGSDDTVF